MMQRRAFVTGMAAALAAPAAVDAQQARKVWRLGYIAVDPAPTPGSPAIGIPAFRAGLRDLGYVEGRDVNITYRWGNLETKRLDGLVADLVASKVDVIVTYATGLVLRLRRATDVIPIVCALCADLVGGGAVASLSRPGRNVTGLTVIGPDLAAKRIEILKTLGLRRVVCLHSTAPTFPVTVRWRRENEQAARVLGLGFEIWQANTVRSLEEHIAKAAGRDGTALSFMEDPFYLHERRRIADLALKHGLPAIFPFREHVEAGGTLSYGADISALFRHAARYVDKILKGASPANLPVEQPSNFEFVINRKTAGAIGLALPPALLLRADQIIE